MQQNINKSAEELTAQNSGGLPEQPASRIVLVAVLIIAVCSSVLITHWPALSAQTISIDDRQYFIENFLVRSPGWESVGRFLTEILEPSTVGGYYQPLTMISLMLDYAVGGQTDSLRPFHRTSLALHIANTALIVVLLYQLFGSVWIAAAVGLLFGVHPLTVEPIPWVSERKTLLAAFFSLWGLIFYARFARRGNLKIYLGCLVMYMLAVMSKPTSTPLPVMLLLMDYWPLRRLKWRTILEKLPFFVIGGASAVITYISQSRTAGVIMPRTYGPSRILFIICHDVVFYLYKMIWPINLTSHYPFPKPLGFASPMVMIGVIGTCILIPLLVLSLRWTRAALTGWLIFFVAVFPTMQTVQFSDAVASDKFVYLPSIGLLMILTAFLGWICNKEGTRRYMVRCMVAAIIVLILAGAESLATRRHLADWQDTVSFFARMTKIAPDSRYSHNNLGAALAERGDIEQAVKCFEEVVKIKPDDVDGHSNLGKIFAEQGKYDEAMSHFEKVLRLSPRDARIYGHIGVMLTYQGRFDEAIAVYRKGLELEPRYPAILHNALGSILLQQGKTDEAIPELQIAVKLQPNSTALNNLGVALVSKGRIDEAMECHKKAIRLDPKSAEAYYDLGSILLAKGRFEQAVGEYEKALCINPKYTKVHSNLAIALAQQGRLEEAIEHFTEAAKIEPNSVDAHYNLAMALGQQNRVDEAIEHFAEAAKIEPNNVEVHYGLAGALVDKGRLQEAAKEYRQVLRLEPGDVDTRCILGDVLAKQGRFEEAAAEYREVLKINPQHPQAQQGLKNIPSRQQPGQTTK